MITISKIAEATGLSQATVSKALRGSTDVNAETTRKVRAAARELGYDISRLHSKTGNSTAIGVVFMELGSEYYNGIYLSLKEKLESAGYRLLTMLAGFEDESGQIDCIDYFIRARVSGIIFLTELDVNVEHLRRVLGKSGIPSVIITRMSRIDFCDVISVNHRLGVKMGVEYLHSMGHNRIAFLGEEFTVRRMNAFRETMAQLNLECPEDYVILSGRRYCDGGADGAGRLLEIPAGRRPTAVFAAYDHLAYGALRTFREAGISVPGDISVMGVDDNQVSRYITPALTTVRMPVESVGERAAELLLMRISGDDSPFQTIYLTPELRRRESVRRL